MRHTPIFAEFVLAMQGQTMRNQLLRHAFPYTTYPLGYVKNLNFARRK